MHERTAGLTRGSADRRETATSRVRALTAAAGAVALLGVGGIAWAVSADTAPAGGQPGAADEAPVATSGSS
jgi:hypothetical protein